MRIIAYKTTEIKGKVLLEESTGESMTSSNLNELLEFLLEPYEATIRVCWHLDETVSLLLRLLEVENCKKLQKDLKVHLPPFDIFYIRGKVLSVTHIPSKHRANLYELEQYYPDAPEPDDIHTIAALGEKMVEVLQRMGLEPTKLTSPIAIYDECVMFKMDLPQAKDIPVAAAEMAYKCAGRLWIEAHQIGYWQKVHDLDLISAFPTAAKELRDTRDCQWVQSSQYQKKAVYGYVKCKVTIYDWVVVSPIIKEVESGLISPVGTWETHLTKGELDFIDKYRIGEYKIIDGWWAIPKGKEMSMPLYAPMKRLLEYKSRGELQELLAKRMSTGVYGKFGEEHQEEFGDHFNSCWFAEISTQTRLRVAEFLYTYGIGPEADEEYNTLIHISVDGVMLTSPISTRSGKWKLNYEGEVLVISSGLVYTERTRPKGLRLADILEMIGKEPKAKYYSKQIRRRLTLGDALAQNKIGDIGKEAEFNSSISLIKQEHDRKFEKLPKTGEQLLENKYRSVPIVVKVA